VHLGGSGDQKQRPKLPDGGVSQKQPHPNGRREKQLQMLLDGGERHSTGNDRSLWRTKHPLGD